MKSSLHLTVILPSVLLCSVLAAAQSTSQDFPTPVLTNEITGSIKARDIGDSRLTTYFYTFNGDQGDLFINIVTRNFTGDLDIFTVAGLRPVTKIVIYASDSENETGRAVYFRKTEKLLLRMQGRSPNDDPASFRIKFAGSFVAAKESDVLPEPELPKVTATNESGIRVNSVGTILPQPPKPVVVKSDPVETADNADAPKKEDPTAETIASGEPPKPEAEKPRQGLEVVVTDNFPKKDEAAVVKPAPRTRASRRRRTPSKPAAPKPAPDEAALETRRPETPPVDAGAESKNVEPPPAKRSVRKPNTRTAKKPAEPKVTAPDPLASIRLVIAFKDGKMLEKNLSEVFKFSVDKGILTVILKDGSISRYPIVEVAKVTIE